MRYYLLITILLVFSTSKISAQDPVVLFAGTDGGTFTTCDGELTTNPFAGLPYFANTNSTIVLTSGTADGVIISFSQFDVIPGDFLTIYDGADNTAPQVPGSPFTGPGIPGDIVSSGTSLSINFTTDGVGEGTGALGTTSCQPLGPPAVCLIDGDITFLPLPDDGICDQLQDYQTCYTVNDWATNNPNGLHGLLLELGPGWDVNSISNLTMNGAPLPGASCDGSPGSWDFYPMGITSTGSGISTGAGFFFDADGDGNPGNNVGDNCIGNAPIQFCWSMQLIPCVPGDPLEDADASVTVDPTSDGETGSLNDATCANDPTSTVPLITGCGVAAVDCVTNPPTASVIGGGLACPPDAPEFTLTINGVAPFTIEYEVNGTPMTINTSDFLSTFPMSPSLGFPETVELLSITDANCMDIPLAGMVTGALTENPTVTISGGGVICPGESVDIDLTVDFTTDNPGPYTVVYAIDGLDQAGVTFPGFNFSFPSTAEGTYTISSVASADCSTPSTTGVGNATVTALTGVSASISGDFTECPDESILFDCEVIGGGPIDINVLLNGAPYDNLFGIAEGTFTYGTSDPGTYTLQAVGASVCGTGLDGSMGTLTNVPEPNITLSGDATICDGESTDLQFDLTGTGPWEFVYQLDGVAQAPVNTPISPVIIPVTTGGTYVLISGNDDNCDATLSGGATVTVTPTPTAMLDGDVNLCPASTAIIPLVLDGTGLFTIDYTIDGAPQPTLLTDGSTPWEATLPGLYELTSAADANCNATVSGSTQLILVDPPTVSLIGDTTVCAGVPAPLDITVTGSGNVTFDLLLGGAPVNSFAIPTSTETYMAMDMGEYTIVSITDDNCTVPAAEMATVTYSTGPIVDLVLDTTLCIGSDFILTAQGTSGGGAPYTYAWVIDGDTLVGQEQTIEISATNVYEVIVSDACGISSSGFTVVNSSISPSFAISADPLFICGSDGAVINTEIPLSTFGDSCVWTLGDQVYMGCDSFVVMLDSTGLYDLSLYVRNTDGCVTDSIYPEFVQATANPIAGFTYTPNEPTIVTDLLQITDFSINADTYTYFLDSLLISEQPEPQIDLPDLDRPGSYTLCQVVANEGGCTDTLCQQIIIDGDWVLHVPNAFTPDNDGINDDWKPLIIGAQNDGYNLSIFNRWGSLIWSTEDIDEKWLGQGAVEGEYFATDLTYVWQMELRRTGSIEKRQYRGTVTILR